MLCKLIKHDLRSLNHFLPALHVAILIVTLLMRFFLGFLIPIQPTSLTSIFLYIMFLIIIMFATELLIGIHFYKSIFSDEGYLTHTLPVTSNQILLSKVIVGGIWIAINISLTLLCSCIVLSAPILNSLFSVTYTDMLVLFSTCILQGIMDVIVIYASVCAGQFFPNRPVLAAVIIYFAVSLIRSIISALCTTVIEITPEWVSIAATKSAAEELGIISYDSKSLVLNIILAVITIVVLYPAAQYFLKKEVNLA